MKTIVVNLFGAPGSGKSTGAAHIFSRLKRSGVKAELVTEFAKDEVWEQNATALDNQEFIFGTQSLRQSRLNGKVDVIVTDSPLLLTMIYGHSPHQGYLNALALSVFNEYENMNYFVERCKPYENSGRLQTEVEAANLVYEICQMLTYNKVPFKNVDGTTDGYDDIFYEVLDVVKKKGETNGDTE